MQLDQDLQKEIKSIDAGINDILLRNERSKNVTKFLTVGSFAPLFFIVSSQAHRSSTR